MSIAISGHAFARTSPGAKLFFMIILIYGTLNALDTTTYAASTEQQIDGAGYDCSYQTNASSDTILNALGNSAILFVSASGSQRRVYCIDANNNLTLVESLPHFYDIFPADWDITIVHYEEP